MPSEESRVNWTTGDTLSDLHQLRLFAGAPAEFWPAFLRASAQLVGAIKAVLLLKPSGTPTANWKRLGQWTGAGLVDTPAHPFNLRLAELASRCADQGVLSECLDGQTNGKPRPFALAVLLRLQNSTDHCVAAFLATELTAAGAAEALTRLRLVSDVPASYQANHQTLQARSDVDRFASTLDLMAQVNAEKRFMAAALAFCNGLATRHHCDRVSLGWVEHGYVRLKAISRTERFDRQMAAVKALEVAMEESMSQDEEVIWPAAEGARQVSRDHETFAREQGSKQLCSLPLRLDHEVVGVLTCDRESPAFAEVELRELRLACDQSVRRLSDLKHRDRWFGARWLAAAREGLAKFLGVERTWYKFLGIVVAVALLLVLVVRMNYRVEANFILHSDEVAFLSAPFEGFIDEVPVRVGDPVEPGQPLVSLAKDDLVLEEVAAQADLTRYTRETEKARAIRALADMRIAEALADQARARLELVRYRLQQADLKAPFQGVIVEGDLRERIGAPVRQGDLLMKVARTDALYLEAEVNERDIHEIRDQALGEMAFASQPKLKFPIRVVRIRAAAQPKEGENVFIVRCAIQQTPEAWWRPGMSGVTKIHVGQRSLLWILTHRTVDYLRLLLWW
jgi:hypothetical protein